MSQPNEEEKAFFTGVNVIVNRKGQQEKTKQAKGSKRAISALPKRQNPFVGYQSDNEINYRHVSYNKIYIKNFS